mmetsp:Transcript_15064/g.33201  ORF Transcript_15064/g.33201 Transcript_15064/m.33201 type:complete len:1521 (-) Transcript_15064:165-4727(-)|eukprot:CAMPEP_0173215754 /NCGR_PEP_ID=MMETSP1141-20130122/26663_1 /TAXON_ID=483371 /ORGANISM="non described non described, Strain CCMP2298" /LENGTH=1520 /DNA_ID=CAMNT_0014143183 /DNA_START=101 /DNA_END=4663 /DNA_ORIENTATION=-
MDRDTSVKVAVRIRPLSSEEELYEPVLCINTIPEESQIVTGNDTFFTFDHVFGAETVQSTLYNQCVTELVDAFFEGFNATILAYGQTGSGKTWTMGSSSDMNMSLQTIGIIPRMIQNLFEEVRTRERDDPSSTYKIHVQFLEIYGEDIRDLLDQTKTSTVTIRETPMDGVFVAGAREELVSSYEQMMKALEDGTRHRTTAATRMNLTSSRSHAIFTVILEHTIYDGVMSSDSAESGLDSAAPKASHQEVRRSKFHFVDLAGSERAKRTGAQGQQLKEGIDINKGLLALGNVISALGDESKRGKFFVPYRDSKLTRMLQDSLGGNSKTLMICCVSASSLNFNESVNALRYANRARNIKNKPIVNRDPTLVMIDELKHQLKNISSELLEMRTKKQYVEVDNPVPIELLENWAYSAVKGLGPMGSPSAAASRAGLASGPASPERGHNRENREKKEQEMATLRSRVRESDYEAHRLTGQLKQARAHLDESNESLILASSERDFYKIELAEFSPGVEAIVGEDGVVVFAGADGAEEKKKVMAMDVMSTNLREIDRLRRQLAMERAKNVSLAATLSEHKQNGNTLDDEFTNSIDTLLNQTREQLRMESVRLKGIDAVKEGVDEKDEEGSEDEVVVVEIEKSYADLEDEQQTYLRRQHLLTTEVEELGQSIALKEQLMAQLTRSQEQYGAMKAFYEQKLSLLSQEMQKKQGERDRLERELQEVSGEKYDARELQEEREKRLRDQLKKKDDELRGMKKKQDELSRLSQMQTRYSNQLSKLENDITSMKRQRVDLSKTLSIEKKNHLIALADKAKEIEKLKRELVKSTNEVRKLGRDKELAESKAKDALREGVVLKKKTQELLRANSNTHSLSSARSAYRAVNKMSRISSNLSGAKRILTEEELRTKRWIDKRIEEISGREAAAEALKVQYEHQLELLNRKESLEQERSVALSMTGGTLEEKVVDSGLLLTAEEKEKLLTIEDQLTSIDGELDERHVQISNIAQQIANSGDVAGSEKTMEVLKRTAAGSLPAAHELIRLLFDMLIMSSRSFQIRWDELNEYRDREEAYKQDIDDLHALITADKRAHDLELTRSANEYEEKLQDLFEQIAVSNYKLFEKDGEGVDQDLDPARIVSPEESAKQQSQEPMRLQLAVSTEECKFLRVQLAREGTRVAELNARSDELDRSRAKLLRESREKADHIRFLEEDRSLFKTLADDLKAGLQSLGKPGKTIVDSVRHRHQGNKSNRGLFAEYTSLSDNEDEDTESVLGEFDFLAEEIFRTGGITASGEKPAQSRSIYDRLTNPSNFTGHMKTVFENDLELKRKKIQQIKDRNPNVGRRPPYIELGLQVPPPPPSSHNSSFSYRSFEAAVSSGGAANGGVNGGWGGGGTSLPPSAPSSARSTAPSRRNNETQKFFHEFYDRTGAPTGAGGGDRRSPTQGGDVEHDLSDHPALLMDTDDRKPRSGSSDEYHPSDSPSPRISRDLSPGGKELRELSPAIKRSYPPRPPTGGPSNPVGVGSPQEWSISSDPWR